MYRQQCCNSYLRCLLTFQYFVQDHAVTSAHKQDTLDGFEEPGREVHREFVVVRSVTGRLLDGIVEFHYHIFGLGICEEPNGLVLRLNHLLVTGLDVAFPSMNSFDVAHCVTIELRIRR